MDFGESGKSTPVSRTPRFKVLKLSDFTVPLVVMVIFFIAAIGQKKYLIVIFTKFLGPNNKYLYPESLVAIWKIM